MNAPTSPSTDSLWTRRFVWLLAGVFVFRLAFMLFFTASADLAGDEAYYWDWGRRPDWGYFSKPPMIGWLMGLVGWLTGNAEWGVRLAPLLLGTATLAALFALVRRIFNARTGFLVALLVLLTPGNIGLNLFFTIDAPLLLFWALSLLLYWFAAEKPTCLWRWTALALTIGLGTLSKQMMLVFPAQMILFALLSKADRPLLSNIRFWASMLVGTAFITPVLWWNTQHDWITLEHTKHHFDASSVGFGGWITRTLEFPAFQALVYSPLTFAAMVGVLGLAVWHWKSADRSHRFLILFSFPVLAAFLLLSLRQRINPNWPGVFYLPAFILVAHWFATSESETARKWKKWTLRVAAGFAIGAHLLVAVVVGPSPEFWAKVVTTAGEWFGPKAEQRIEKSVAKLAELKGWDEVGVQAGRFLEQVPRPENTFVLATGYRYDAAQLAFNMPQHPRTYRWERSGNVLSQYEVWPGPEERLGDDALIFKNGSEEPGALFGVIAQRFEKVDRLGQVKVNLGKNTWRIYDVFLGHKLLSWEKPGAGKAP